MQCKGFWIYYLCISPWDQTRVWQHFHQLARRLNQHWWLSLQNFCPKHWQTRVQQHNNGSILHVSTVCFYLFIFSFWLSMAGWLISVLVCGAIMVMINTNLQLLPRSSTDVVVWSSLTNLKRNKVQQVELLLGGHPWQKNGNCYAWYNGIMTRASTLMSDNVQIKWH